MPRKKLCMYVWEGVLCDHTPGMIAVLARGLERAIELATLAVYPDEKRFSRVRRAYIEAAREKLAKELRKTEPSVVEKEEAFFVHGGG